MSGGGRPCVLLVEVNGEQRAFDPGATVADVVALLGRPPQGLAVARNGTIVPRGSWASTPLDRDDRLEILAVVAGG